MITEKYRNLEKKIIPICSHCMKVRDTKGLWRMFNQKFSKNTKIDFSHSVCPECRAKFYKGM
ncbi:MAG: hypothetical protein PF638_09035 [Candidatus Delongbacteria bacterium]|jgi:hypothetical protein|nr:hypothetical protein [Candidatus Delongbacteria bacterium]